MRNLDRFIEYVKIDTQSDDTTGKTPSTDKQKVLGVLLVKQLVELGLSDAHMDEWGNVYGHLPGVKGITIGLNAHMDTALEVTGKGVKPALVNEYDGFNRFNGSNGLYGTMTFFPFLIYMPFGNCPGATLRPRRS